MLIPANGWLAVFEDAETNQMFYAPLICWLQTGINVIGQSRAKEGRSKEVVGGLQPAFQLRLQEEFRGYIYRPKLWATLAAMHASILPMSEEALPGEGWETA